MSEEFDPKKCLGCRFFLICVVLQTFSSEELDALEAELAKLEERAKAYEQASHGGDEQNWPLQ
ncbi:MAG: hypothetical protein GWN93_05975 [Deltaproteobacteria bacterium]|nr:hypothetical protein [Deltaproteobacteria bacterium]